MFTIEQIKEAHSKVKSGADFPQYVQKLKVLGLHYYDNYVTDGHTDYYGTDSYSIIGPAKYDVLKIASTGDKAKLERDLKVHQAGESDYQAFCRQAADAGVNKWTVDVQKMTCVYYDTAGNAMVTEKIPVP